MTRSVSRAALVVVLAAGITAMAATVAAAAGERKAEDSLTVAIPNPLVNYTAPFVAKAAGYFEKHGVNVTLREATGANTLNMLVTGEADIAISSSTQGMQLSQQGKQVSHFYIYSRDPGSWLIGAPGITSLEQAKALGDKCKILGGLVGSQSYGFGFLYRDVKRLGLEKCSVDSAPTTATLLARMASGQATLASVPYTTVKLAIQAYGAKVLINPNLPGYRKQYNLPNFISGTWYGLQDNLQAKRSAVVKFVRAINDASTLMVPKNLTQLTRYLQGFGSFNTVEFNSLRTQLQNTIRYIGAGTNQATAAEIKKNPKALKSNPGWITQKAWTESLRQYAKWDVPSLQLSSEVHSYRRAVDMSYLTEALRKKSK
jgi:ABC-type nitrate/sulfonate/bicarbonate transport system substrate-binding protein